jgi:hypothetical protein
MENRLDRAVGCTLCSSATDFSSFVRSNNPKKDFYSELARIGSQLFVFGSSTCDQTAASPLFETFATRLSTQPAKKARYSEITLPEYRCSEPRQTAGTMGDRELPPSEERNCVRPTVTDYVSFPLSRLRGLAFRE